MDLGFDFTNIFKIPSEEQLDKNAREWWAMLEPHCFHKWSPKLLELTYPLLMVGLPRPLIERLLHAYDGLSKEASQELESDLVALIDGRWDFSERFFMKLCSRSPKDFLSDGPTIRPLTSSWEMLTAIMASERCLDDLCMLARIDNPYLVLRPYIDIEPWREFRVFVKDGKVAGISQYHYTLDFEFTDQNIDDIDWLIRDFMDNSAIPNFPLPDFVADIVFDDPIMLLEINPFGLSDPCLFKSYDNLDGTTKIIRV